jgi:predicted Zn-dependent protease
MSWLLQIVMTLVSSAWLLGSPSALGVSATEPVTADPRPPLVVVRALGPVPTEQLRAACRVLLAEYPVRCVVRARRSMTEVLSAWNAERTQLDARETLDLLFETRSRDAVVELDVTAFDLYEPGKPYVFGLASLPDRTALLSSSRLSSGLGEDAVATARLRTLVRHEFGHALGLSHHDVADCVMRQDPTVHSLDLAPEGPCLDCRDTIDQQLVRLARPGQTALDRARGLLIRDRREQARRTLVEALWAYPPDLELLDAFARVFYEAGQYNEAISLLRHTADKAPHRATTYVQLGLAYQNRGRDGDLALAVGHFEQAMELRPDWNTVADHLEVTRAELRAQGPS